MLLEEEEAVVCLFWRALFNRANLCEGAERGGDQDLEGLREMCLPLSWFLQHISPQDWGGM